MTQYTAADLAMADRHIAAGESHIARQEELVSSLEMQGYPSAEAETLLRLFYDTQVEHRVHRDAIKAALDQATLQSQLSRKPAGPLLR